MARLDVGDLDPELRQALADKLERLGYLGEFFAVAGHQPAALAGFIRFTDELRRDLGPALSEVVALASSSALGNDYERHQHERLALSLGFSPAWVLEAEAEAADPGGVAGELSEIERRARAVALAVARDPGRGAPAEVAALREVADDRTTVAIVLSAARFVAHAAVIASFAIAPPVPSPLTRDASHAEQNRG